MKVLYLIDTLEGYGAEKSIVQIALNMEKITPVFVHLYEGDKLKPLLVEAGIKVYSLDIKSNEGYKAAIKKLPKIINREKPKILHSSLFRADMVARKLKKTYPNLVLVGSFVSNSYSTQRYSTLPVLSKIKLLRTQYRDRMSARRVDYFICNSETIKKSNTAALNIPSEKIKVIYRGRCFKEFEPDPNQVTKLKNDLNLTSETVFLNVGRLIRSKGQLDLLEAFRIYIDYNPSSVLLLAGEGGLRDDLERKIKQLKLEQHVRLLGYREDIPELLRVADFFVFPSYYEGLPGALIEAIISKTPSIVSDISENRECFETDGALFFPPGNIHSLYVKLKEAVDLKDWKQRVELAFDFARNNFEIRKISKEYEEFYNSLQVKEKEEA